MKHLRDLKREAIDKALEQCGGNRLAASRLLGIGRTTIYRLARDSGQPRRRRGRPVFRPMTFVIRTSGGEWIAPARKLSALPEAESAAIAHSQQHPTLRVHIFLVDPAIIPHWRSTFEGGVRTGAAKPTLM